MPIEILPAGLPDWVQFDSTDDIDFLVEDPFWPTKVGSNNPDLAILYRSHNPGVMNCIEKSEDGGKTWAQITLPDTFPWYSGATFTHMNVPGYGMTYEPMPKIDPELSRPHTNHLTYRAYASNPARIGEHAVLATHNYVDGVEEDWDLASMWVAYTFNDWVVTRWQQILPDMEYWYANINEGSSTQINSGLGSVSVAMAKISETKIAAFHFSGNNLHSVTAYHLTPNGTFTLDDSASKSGIFADVNTFVFGNKVYFGTTYQMNWRGGWIWFRNYYFYDRVSNGGKLYVSKGIHQSNDDNEPGVGVDWQDWWYEDYVDLPPVEPARTEPYSSGQDVIVARVNVWDFTGTTPVFVETYESEELPILSPDDNSTNGHTWIMTEGGRLAFCYGNQTSVAPTSTTPREIHLFYFDCNSNVFSEPYLYMKGSGSTGVPSPWGSYFNGTTYDGGNGAIVCETYKVSWTNRPPDDWYGRLYMMDVGGWYKYDEVELFEDLDASSGYDTYVKDCKKLSHTRFAFHYDRGGVVIASYNPAYHRINTVYEKPQYDYGDGGSPTIMMQEDPITDKVFMSGYGGGNTKSAMFWSKWSTYQPSYPRDPYADILDNGDDFRHKVAFWSWENTPTMHIAFGSHDKYARIWRGGSGPSSYTVNVAITTVGERSVTDTIYSRFYLGTMAFTNDGERLYFGTGDYKAQDSSKIDTWLEYLTREPSSPDYSALWRYGYDNNFGYGWRSTPNSWGDVDENIAIADFLAGESYFNVVTWPVEDDGIILYGLLMYQRVPTSPDQIWIYSVATGWDVLWDNGHAASYVDPVRALIYYDDLIYAVIKTSTGIELYVSDPPPYGTAGDYMTQLSDSPLDDCGIACMDYDPVDGTLVIGQKVANLLMIAVTPPPYTTWYNLTLSHRNDLGLTGLVVL